ncbi:MAG: Ig-like domain-containing protein [Planctomycetota bacterium]
MPTALQQAIIDRLDTTLPADYAGVVAFFSPSGTAPRELPRGGCGQNSDLNNYAMEFASLTGEASTFIDDQIGDGQPNSGPSIIEAVNNSDNANAFSQALAGFEGTTIAYAPGTTAAVGISYLATSFVCEGELDFEGLANIGLATAQEGFADLINGNFLSEGLLVAESFGPGSGELGVIGNIVGAAGGLGDVIGDLTGVAGLFGATEPQVVIDPELLALQEETYGQILEMREQLRVFEGRVDQRFDQVDARLSQINDTMLAQFEQLDGSIETVGQNIELLRQQVAMNTGLINNVLAEVARNTALLERIEDALWLIAGDLLEFDLALLYNGILDYFDDTGIALPYAGGSPNFVTGSSDIFTTAVTLPLNNTYAGPADAPALTPENAPVELGDPSFGRRLNQLRTFPGTYGLPALSSTDLPGPSGWTQAAASYAQLARENPWFFAFLLQNQSGQAGPTELDEIRSLGRRLVLAADNARDPALINAFFDDWFGLRFEILTRAQQVVGDELPFDPWGANDALNESVLAPVFRFTNMTNPPFEITCLNGQMAGPEMFFNNPGSVYENTIDSRYWNVYRSLGPAGSVRAAGIGGANHRFRIELVSNTEFDMVFSFTHDSYPGAPVERRLRMRRVNGSGSAQSFDCNPETNSPPFNTNNIWFLWTTSNVLGSIQFAAQNSIQGQTFETGEQFPFNLFVVSDTKTDTLTNVFRQQTLDALATDATLLRYNSELNGFPAIADALLTLGFPELTESSTLFSAGLRGNPMDPKNDASVNPAPNTLRDVFLETLVPGGINGTGLDFDAFSTKVNEFFARVNILRDEALAAADNPQEVHNYLQYTLAELDHLEENANRLGRRDLYSFNSSSTLVVSAAGGLLANDLVQPGLVVLVDPASVTQPATGTVSVNADGSFSYTPDPQAGANRQTFTYRLVSDVSGAGGIVTSEPIVVEMIRREATNSCSGDFNNDGDVDLGDFGVFGQAFNSFVGDPNYDAAADFNNDGDVDLGDFGVFGAEFNRTDCLN